MCTESLPLSSVSSSVPWDVVGKDKLYYPVDDHETQVDVQIVIIHDHRNYFKLYVMHKEKTISRRRARPKSKSFTAELLSVSESSGSTISITSIPSPVDEATNDSSISSQPVNEGKREQHNLSSFLSYLKPFYLCFPPVLLSLLSKLANPLHLHCMSISSFIPNSFSFILLSVLWFSCPFLVSVFLKSSLLVIAFASLPFSSLCFSPFLFFSISKVTPDTLFYLFRAMTIAEKPLKALTGTFTWIPWVQELHLSSGLGLRSLFVICCKYTYLQLYPHHSCAWILLFGILTYKLTSWSDLEYALSLWTCLAVMGLCLTLFSLITSSCSPGVSWIFPFRSL